VVIGAGQSALESAALLKEAGAGVEVLARRPVRFLRRSTWLHSLGPVSNLLYASSDVGPAGVSRVAAAPALYRHFAARPQRVARASDAARRIRLAG